MMICFFSTLLRDQKFISTLNGEMSFLISDAIANNQNPNDGKATSSRR